jgi:hypothetical protein
LETQQCPKYIFGWAQANRIIIGITGASKHILNTLVAFGADDTLMVDQGGIRRLDKNLSRPYSTDWSVSLR